MTGPRTNTRLNAQRKSYTAARATSLRRARSRRKSRRGGRAGELRPVLHVLPRRASRLSRTGCALVRSASAAFQAKKTSVSRWMRSLRRDSPPRDAAGRAGHRDDWREGARHLARGGGGRPGRRGIRLLDASARLGRTVARRLGGRGRDGTRATGRLDRAGRAAGQMHGLVVLDEEQRVLRPAILWNDQRTAAECARSRSGSGSGG